MSNTEYVKLEGEKSCDCSVKVVELLEQLAESKKMIDRLTVQVQDHLPPFRFVSDDFTQTHTGLPNLKVVKAIFCHASKSMPFEKATTVS